MAAKEKMPNIGRKIERIRMLRGIKQDVFATMLGVTQGAVSRMEQSEKVSDDKLEKVAQALGVTTDAIKNFDESASINNVQNTFYDNAVQNQFNPIEKLIETVEENKKLYERLLKEKDSVIEIFKQQLKQS